MRVKPIHVAMGAVAVILIAAIAVNASKASENSRAP